MKHYIGEKVKLYAPGYGVINGVITHIIRAGFYRIQAENEYIYCRYDLDLEGWK